MADRPPVIAAWGAGVDSTAMIVELAERGEPIDMVLFADLGAEKSNTYAFIPLFRAWMAERGIASEIVRYAAPQDHPRDRREICAQPPALDRCWLARDRLKQPPGGEASFGQMSLWLLVEKGSSSCAALPFTSPNGSMAAPRKVAGGTTPVNSAPTRR